MHDHESFCFIYIFDTILMGVSCIVLTPKALRFSSRKSFQLKVELNTYSVTCYLWLCFDFMMFVSRRATLMKRLIMAWLKALMDPWWHRWKTFFDTIHALLLFVLDFFFNLNFYIFNWSVWHSWQPPRK